MPGAPALAGDLFSTGGDQTAMLRPAPFANTSTLRVGTMREPLIPHRQAQELTAEQRRPEFRSCKKYTDA